MLKNLDLKNKVLPHVLVIVSFVLISYGFLQPAMEGKILKQGDIIQYKGAARSIEDYNEKTGETALWTNALFSGMPSLLNVFINSGSASSKLFKDAFFLGAE